MNLREQILLEHSKENADLIANWVGKDKSRLDKLIHIFLNDDYRVVQRAAYAVSKIADNEPSLMLPYLDKMVAKMDDNTQHVAVKRNVLRILQNVNIPEHLHGEVMNHGFNILSDVREPIALRVFSMTILDNLSKQYPEIRQELISIIENELELGASAGFKSRAKKILKKK